MGPAAIAGLLGIAVNRDVHRRRIRVILIIRVENVPVVDRADTLDTALELVVIRVDKAAAIVLSRIRLGMQDGQSVIFHPRDDLIIIRIIRRPCFKHPGSQRTFIRCLPFQQIIVPYDLAGRKEHYTQDGQPSQMQERFVFHEREIL